MTLPLPPAVWHRRAKAVRCRWIETPRTAKEPRWIECLDCGHEWLAIPDNVRIGNGCPGCIGGRSVQRTRRDGTREKFCTKCKEWKNPKHDFSASSREADGLCGRCKGCAKKAYHATKNCGDRVLVNRVRRGVQERRCFACLRWKVLDKAFSESTHDKGYGRQRRCKECTAAINDTPRGRELLRARLRRFKASEKGRAARKRWEQSENGVAVRKAQVARYQAKPKSRLMAALRGGIRDLLQGRRKPARTMVLLGCDRDHLMRHLEVRFEPDMTWENYGEWHVDHIVPVASIDITDPDQIRMVCHFSNLQPLWAEDNMAKGAKLDWQPPLRVL